MDFTIRPARMEDAAAIALVHVESWRSTYAGIVPDEYLASFSVETRTRAWQEQFAGAMNLLFVAEDATGIFGFASGGKLRDAIDGYDAELYAIYLLQQKQRRGAGRLLLRKLADSLRAQGFRSLIAWVLERNPSVGFYDHLGGSQVAEKQIEIGGVQLTELALGWINLDELG